MTIRATCDVCGAEGWRPIDSAPKSRTVLVGYPNQLGKWRTVRASYYPPNTLELSEESYNYHDSDTGFAEEGWYEETETHEDLRSLDCEPTHWMPLPPTPEAYSRLMAERGGRK